jgi:Ca2+-binding RTX toxin-like protein
MRGRLVVVAAACLALVGSTGSGRAQVSTECAGEAATIVGTEGDDTITGTPADDVISALGGNDTINGAGGDDLICGGDGNDTVVGGPGDDDFGGGAGDDLIDGSSGDDLAFYDFAPAAVVVDLAAGTAAGGDGSDALTAVEDVSGSELGDTLRGDGGSNLLIGQGGDDVLDGRAGSDLISGSSGDDTFIGGRGEDLAYFTFSPFGVHASLATGRALGWGRDRLRQIEDLDGSSHDDKLVGNDRRNWIRGLAGNDAVFGAAGNDLLEGGKGKDRVDGGPGRDLCLTAERKKRCP